MYSNIPIVIICYNNYKYVKNTLDQIKKINLAYYKNIIIMDNCSTCTDTIHFLKNINIDVDVNVKVIYMKANISPRVSKDINQNIYNILPDKFILTDPDLKLNKNIPNNFIEILNSFLIQLLLAIYIYFSFFLHIYYIKVY